MSWFNKSAASIPPPEAPLIGVTGEAEAVDFLRLLVFLNALPVFSWDIKKSMTPRLSSVTSSLLEITLTLSYYRKIKRGRKNWREQSTQSSGEGKWELHIYSFLLRQQPFFFLLSYLFCLFLFFDCLKFQASFDFLLWLLFNFILSSCFLNFEKKNPPIRASQIIHLDLPNNSVS